MRMSRWRSVCAASALALATSFAPAHASPEDDTLRAAMAEEILNLDYNYTTKREYIILAQLTDATLFNIDPETQEVNPSIATGYEWVDDMTLDVTLRDASETARWTDALDGASFAPGHVRLPAHPVDGNGAIPALPGFAEGAWWVQDIAAAAGVSKPIFYRHFENKQAIFERVVAHVLAQQAHRRCELREHARGRRPVGAWRRRLRADDDAELPLQRRTLLFLLPLKPRDRLLHTRAARALCVALGGRSGGEVDR